MNSIVQAGLVGAIGGAFGAGIAWLIGKALGRRPAWLPAIPAAFIALALGLNRGLQPQVADQVMAELNQLPTVAAIKAHYPAQYEALQARVGALHARSSREEVEAAVASVVQTLIREQLPKADEKSSYRLFAVTRAEGGALKMVDPAGCVSFLQGSGSPSLAKVMTPELMAQDGRASSALLEQTARRPAAAVPPIDDAAAQALAVEALSTMPTATRAVAARVIDSGRGPAGPEEQAAICDFKLSFFDAVLRRPKPEAGRLVRALWAAN